MAAYSWWSKGISVGYQLQTITTEISGLDSMRLTANAGYAWAVDDNGSLYAIDLSDGSSFGAWTHGDFSAGDWEDVATQDVSGTAYVYVAHIGDNASNRAGNYFIYRCEEEAVTGAGTFTVCEEIEFQYPASPTGPNDNAKRDAECIIVDLNGDIIIFSKRESTRPTSPGTRVFKIAHQASYTGVQTATYLGTINTTKLPTDSTEGYASTVVGGGMSPDGHHIVLKNYEEVRYWYRADTDDSIWDTLNDNDPVVVDSYGGHGLQKANREPKGEAVCFDINNKALYTTSEHEATDQKLYRYTRLLWEPTTVTLEHGVNGVTGTDTYIDQNAPTTAYGSATQFDLDAGPNRRDGLIKFEDIVGSNRIPTGAQIVHAELEFTVGAGLSGSGFQTYKMLQTWTTAATWNNIFGFNGVDINDVEASSTKEGEVGRNENSGVVTAGTIRLNVSAQTVQDWVDGGDNYGWVLRPFLPNGLNGLEPYTFDHTKSSERPKLIVQYVMPVTTTTTTTVAPTTTTTTTSTTTTPAPTPDPAVTPTERQKRLLMLFDN